MSYNSRTPANLTTFYHRFTFSFIRSESESVVSVESLMIGLSNVYYDYKNSVAAIHQYPFPLQYSISIHRNISYVAYIVLYKYT